MKKTLLIILTILSLNALQTFAQVTLTATGINPTIGQTWTITATVNVLPGASGANQTWDFSTSMPNSGSSTTTTNTPSSIVNGSNFPSANLAYLTSTNDAAFYKYSTTAWQNYGATSPSQ